MKPGGEREGDSAKQGSSFLSFFDHFIAITERIFPTHPPLLGTLIPLISSKYI